MEALELAVAPLDVARRAALRFATRSALVRRVLARRDSRVACIAAVQIAALFALAVRVPVALFFLGPVVFGVAHLAADVRYLVLRRAPPGALVMASVFFAVAITLVQLGLGAHWIAPRRGDAVSVALGVAWVGAAVVAALRATPRRTGWAIVPLFLAFGGYLVVHARVTGLVLAHAHNLVAVVAWLALFRRRTGWAIVPLALLVGLTAVLLSGSTLPWTFAHDGFFAFGVRIERLGAWLAPGARADVAAALATTFVFLQGVHYAAWTGWIPQDDARSEGTPTFRMSVRALAREFGAIPFTAIVVLTLGFVALATWNLRESVSWYMTMVKAHAWFECAFLCYFAGASRPGARAERAAATASVS